MTVAVGLSEHKRDELQEVFIVGCGGNGSRFIENMLEEPELWQDGYTFWLVDPDKVEKKNLERQFFTSEDIGKYKALVLAEKLIEAGIRAFPVIDTGYVFHVRRARCVLLFLDSIESRRHYRRLLFDKSEIWLDAGNRLFDGQVFCLVPSEASNPFHKLYKAYLAKDDELPACADMPEQSVYINKTVARASYLVFKQIEHGGDLKNCQGLVRVSPEADSRNVRDVTVEEYYAIDGFLLNGKIMKSDEELTLFWKLAGKEGAEALFSPLYGWIVYNVDESGRFSTRLLHNVPTVESKGMFYRICDDFGVCDGLHRIGTDGRPSGGGASEKDEKKLDFLTRAERVIRNTKTLHLAFDDERYIEERIKLYAFFRYQESKMKGEDRTANA